MELLAVVVLMAAGLPATHSGGGEAGEGKGRGRWWCRIGREMERQCRKIISSSINKQMMEVVRVSPYQVGSFSSGDDPA